MKKLLFILSLVLLCSCGKEYNETFEQKPVTNFYSQCGTTRAYFSSNTTEIIDTNNADKIIVSFNPNLDESIICKTDDFYLRIDNIYRDIDRKNINVLVASTGFQISLEDINKQILDKEYTYELYLWAISGYETNFNNSDIETKIRTPTNYIVNCNVFKGLSGHNDTSYIKVSIHITKKEQVV